MELAGNEERSLSARVCAQLLNLFIRMSCNEEASAAGIISPHLGGFGDGFIQYGGSLLDISLQIGVKPVCDCVFLPNGESFHWAEFKQLRPRLIHLINVRLVFSDQLPHLLETIVIRLARESDSTSTSVSGLLTLSSSCCCLRASYSIAGGGSCVKVDNVSWSHGHISS